MESTSEQAVPSVTIQEVATQPAQAEEALPVQTEADIQETGLSIMHATRAWIQYGMLGFAVTLVVIGALEGLLGR